MRPNRFADLTREDQHRVTISVAAWTALILLAAVLLSGRLGGPRLSYPPPAVVLAVSWGCFALGAFAGLTGRIRCEADRTVRWRWPALRIALSVAPPLAIGLSMTPSHATAMQMGLLTLSVASTTLLLVFPAGERRRQEPFQHLSPEVGGRRSEVGDRRSEDGGRRSEDGGQKDHSPPTTHHPPLTTHHPPLTTHHSPLPSSLWSQSMRRTVSPDGAEEIVEGVATASFCAGQKQAVIHVPFCPPLWSAPSVECEPADDAEVRWKATVVQPFGLRIDVHRNGRLDRPESIRIAYAASARAARKAA